MTPSPWQYFSLEELTCKCGCGRWEVQDSFMQKLVALRRELGFAFILTSAFRCPEYDAQIAPGKFNPRPHALGLAVDIHVTHHKAHRLIEAAIRHGFTGIGIAQKGPIESRFIHVDTVLGNGYPRPTVWSY